jgi:hypothetical protein
MIGVYWMKHSPRVTFKHKDWVSYTARTDGGMDSNDQSTKIFDELIRKIFYQILRSKLKEFFIIKEVTYNN